MKITELEGIAKGLLKKKTLPLYKAFYIKEEGEEMRVNTAVDLLALSEKAALEEFVNNDPDYGEYLRSTYLENNDKFSTICFAVFQIDMKDLKEKDLLDEGDVFFKNDVLSITLNDKIYKVDVIDKDIRNLVMEFLDNRWKIKDLEMEDVKK